jgi:hypothetical protein
MDNFRKKTVDKKAYDEYSNAYAENSQRLKE